jgi:1-acyl-sn-glycerol-3-phosphate acyltransferase
MVAAGSLGPRDPGRGTPRRDRVVDTPLKVLTGMMLLLARILYGMRVEGLENLPREGPYILGSTELGRMGHMMAMIFVLRLVFSVLLDPPIGIADEYNWPAAREGTYSRIGFRPVFPHGRAHGVSALLAALRSLREGKIVAMNPAGEMSWDGRLVPPSPGVAWLALRSGVPIVLVVPTKGAYEIWPKWAERPHLNGRFRVRVGRPFRVTETPRTRVTDEMIARANDRITQQMTALIFE